MKYRTVKRILTFLLSTSMIINCFSVDALAEVNYSAGIVVDNENLSEMQDNASDESNNIQEIADDAYGLNIEDENLMLESDSSNCDSKVLFDDEIDDVEIGDAEISDDEISDAENTDVGMEAATEYITDLTLDNNASASTLNHEAALENDEILAGETDDFGTPGENYAPGEVIVCVKGGSEALLKSDIFNGISNRAYSNAANGMQSPDSFDDVHSSADDIEGLSALFAATTITIEEKLMSLDMDEALVESIATGDTHEYAKAVYDNNDSLENPVADVDAFGKNQANYESCNDEYDIVLIKSADNDVSELISRLEEIPCVMFAEPNGIYTTEAIGGQYDKTDATNEPLYKYQWYADNKYGMNVDVNAETVYENVRFKSQNEVVVAVMDSGVDYTHPDLEDAMWSQGEEIPELMALGGGKYGINTAPGEQSNNPMDSDVGHGTHCASTIASTWKNNEGIAGVNGNAKIMACRWMSGGGGVVSNYIKAMEYVMTAKEKGVNVVATNNSWGTSYSTAYNDKVVDLIAAKAADEGIVTCFAAGNESLDLDNFTNHTYNSPYILTVGAMDSAGNPAYFTNRGISTVDVYAPGTQILAATSLQQSNVTMTPQYLPWLQSSDDSFFYEDFEDFSNKKLSLKSYEIDDNTGEKSNVVVNDEPSTFGFLSDTSDKIVFDSDITEGDTVGVEIAVSMNAILGDEGKLPDSEDYYIAFEGGVDNVEIMNESGSPSFSLEYCKKDGEEESWNSVAYNAVLRMADSNWSVSNTKLSKEDMQVLIDAAATTDNVLKLRLTSQVESIDAGADFYIDSLGFGTKVSEYYYSDGTSMATPITTATVSLIAGAMEDTPSSSADVLEIIARVKGGVKRYTANIKDTSVTMGCIQADTVYRSESELYPVPDSAIVNKIEGTAIIKGHFFGTTEGTVTINGRNATVTKWSDGEIEVKIPEDTEFGPLECVITRTDGWNGRDFIVFVSEQSGDGMYEELTTGDFSYGDLKTKDLLPMRMAANDDGLMVVLVDANNTYAELEFYSFKDKTWSQIPFPEGYELYAHYMECLYSLVGGKDQFYLLCVGNSDSGVKGLLLTYSTSKNKWEYIVNRGNPNSCMGEYLALDKDGKLLMGGNNTDTLPHICQIYPDTGSCIEKISEMPEEYYDLSGGDYLISGDMQILVGMNEGILGRVLGDFVVPGSPVKNPLILKDGKWIAGKTPFFATDGTSKDGLTGAGLDKGQVYIGAYGALDSGFILAGPSRNIGKTDMVDTWIYNAETDTYTALPARVDGKRMKMQAGACHGDKFYVIGHSAITGELFLKSLDLTKYGVHTTDKIKNAELEKDSKYITAIGSTWFDKENVGYYIADTDGQLTKEGANENNYTVKYNPYENKITLRNANITECAQVIVEGNLFSNIGIYSNSNLIIELIGNNSIATKLPKDDRCLYISSVGIFSLGNITFTGGGNLYVKSGNRSINNYAVYSKKSVDFNADGTINLVSECVDKSCVARELANLGYVLNQAVVLANAVNIKSGKVILNAESIDILKEEYGGVEPSCKLLGLAAENINISGDAKLSVTCGDISGFDKMKIAAIMFEKILIGKSEITASIGNLKNCNNGEIIADETGECYARVVLGALPLLSEGASAKLWFGKDKTLAEAGGAQAFDKLKDCLTEKYIRIETVTDSPKRPDAPDYEAHSLKASDILVSITKVSDKEMEYTGGYITPAVTVKYTYKSGTKNKSVTLKENIDYKLSYVNNKNAGDAIIRVYGIGEYCDSVDVLFTIKPKDIHKKNAKVTITTLPEIIYPGSMEAVLDTLRGSLNVTCSNKELVFGNDFDVEKVDDITEPVSKKGESFNAKVVGKGNYTGEKTFKFKVLNEESRTGRTDISDKYKLVVTGTKLTYTGKPVKPSVKLVDKNGKKLGSSNYVVRYFNNVNAGTATVRVCGKGKCTGCVEKTFVIAPRDITKCKITVKNNSKLKYTGFNQSKNVSFIVKYGNAVLSEGKDYRVEYSGNWTEVTDKLKKKGVVSKEDIPTITIKAIEGGNYYNNQSSGKLLKKTFKIGKATLGSKVAIETSVLVNGISCDYEDGKYVIGTDAYKASTKDGITVNVTRNKIKLEGMKYDKKASTNAMDYTFKITEKKKKGVVVSGTITISGVNRYSGKKTLYFVIK